MDYESFTYERHPFMFYTEAEVGFVSIKQAHLETAFAFKRPSVASVHKTNHQTLR